MAKFVVAGRSDCPYFARAELLGDRLAKNLDMFHLHKIMIQPKEWDQWLHNTCNEKGWKHTKSPMIWRELIDRGGKGVLIGGANEFQEYVKAYYDLESEMNSYDMRTISQENKVTKDELDEEDRQFKALSQPVHICITNAASPITYHLLHSLSSGQVLGSKVEVKIHLLVSSSDDVDFVKGTSMEVEDLAHPLMRGVNVCTDPREAFKDCSVVILLDEFLKDEDEKKIDWLKRNHEFFSNYAAIINSVSLNSCKVVVCGSGPLNFNAMAIIQAAPKLNRQNVVALSTMKENDAKSVVGERLVVNPAGVVDLLVWGNVNGNSFIDVKQCRVHNYDGAIWGPYWYSVDAMEMIHDNKWIIKEFPGLVKERATKVSEAMKRSTCLSAGNAISTTLSYWFQGSPKGQIFSLGVYSEGWYGVPEGLVFSYPVTLDPKGYWHVTQDIELTPELKQAISESVEDINTELGIFRGEIVEEIKEEAKPTAESNEGESKPETSEESTITYPVAPGDADVSTKEEVVETAEKLISESEGVAPDADQNEDNAVAEAEEGVAGDEGSAEEKADNENNTENTEPNTETETTEKPPV